MPRLPAVLTNSPNRADCSPSPGEREGVRASSLSTEEIMVKWCVNENGLKTGVEFPRDPAIFFRSFCCHAGKNET